MKSLRSFLSFSGGEISKDTKSRKRSLEETTERATEEESEVSQAATELVVFLKSASLLLTVYNKT